MKYTEIVTALDAVITSLEDTRTNTVDPGDTATISDLVAIEADVQTLVNDLQAASLPEIQNLTASISPTDGQVFLFGVDNFGAAWRFKYVSAEWAQL